MTVGPPSDSEIRRGLEDGLKERGELAAIEAIERQPYHYATSFPLEEVVARLADGRALRLILKDLTWERLLGQAGRTKPRFLYDPRRCIDTYRTTLHGTGVGPEFYGSFADDRRQRYWLLFEKVDGVELWQVGDLATWEAVARWLARFHRSFAEAADELPRRNPHLLRYDRVLFEVWPVRALDVATGQRQSLARIVSRYERVVERLVHARQTFVHGELYPSNVLVGDGGPEVKIWPIDWEHAGVGPALLDLAALTAGWERAEQAKLVDAYRDELARSDAYDEEEFDVLLDCCRLHYALQWLGWSAEWAPPPEHARDWVSEAVEVGERLGL